MPSFSSLKAILLLLPFVARGINAAYQWPDPQHEILEKMLFEGTDFYDKATSILTNSCGKRQVGGPPVAAEWLRMSYHDVATKNITDGTGGMDASVYYELSRTENIGTGMQNTVGDLSASSNKYVSRADLIALSVIWGLPSCSGPLLPFRPGRIDSFSAGRFGVPQPQEILSLHLERFRLQGFNQSDMIGLVACGHTMGGVHNLDFPSIVQIPGPGLVVREFDGTDTYDNAVVLQYLNGTTANPLVTIRNTLFQSDLRIFQSDQNATMKGLTDPAVYQATCTSLLTRMLDTVPDTVQLGDPVQLIPFKVTRARLGVVNGIFVFDVLVRVALTSANAASGRAITLLWCDAHESNPNCANSTASSSTTTSPSLFNDVLLSPVAQAQGLNFVEYAWVVPVSITRSVGTFWFEVNEGGVGRTEDNGGQGYSVDDGVVFLPGMGGSSGGSSTVVFGVRSRNTPTNATISIYDNTFLSTPPPPTPFTSTIPLTKSTTRFLPPALALYTVYEATFPTTGSGAAAGTAGKPSVDVSVEVDGSVSGLEFLRVEDSVPTGTTGVSGSTTLAAGAVPTGV